MKKLITDYQKEVEKKIKNKTFTKEDLDDFKVMVGYFEHERLIHLLVTITVIILTCFFFYMFSIRPSIFLFLLVILIPHKLLILFPNLGTFLSFCSSTTTLTLSHFLNNLLAVSS